MQEIEIRDINEILNEPNEHAAEGPDIQKTTFLKFCKKLMEFLFKIL